jgi:transposase-like protein
MKMYTCLECIKTEIRANLAKYLSKRRKFRTNAVELKCFAHFMNASHKSCCSQDFKESMFMQRHLINRKFGGNSKKVFQNFYTMCSLYFVRFSLKGKVLSGDN